MGVNGDVDRENIIEISFITILVISVAWKRSIWVPASKLD
jgi:hypothetical protein